VNSVVREMAEGMVGIFICHFSGMNRYVYRHRSHCFGTFAVAKTLASWRVGGW
jgi:hypothetical protein